MKIQKLNNVKIKEATKQNSKQSHEISFRAIPRDILHSATSAPITKENFAKKRFVGTLGLFFFGLKVKLREIPGAPNIFIYNLKGQNEIPEILKNAKIIDGVTNLKEVDEILQAPSKKDPRKTKGEVLAEHLKSLGIPNPGYLEIEKSHNQAIQKLENEAYRDFEELIRNPHPYYMTQKQK